MNDKTDKQRESEVKLIQFAIQTLCLMDGNADWGADMWGTTACLAHSLGLAIDDRESRFRVTVVDPGELVLRAGLVMEPQEADLYDRVKAATDRGQRLNLRDRAKVVDVTAALRLLRLGLLEDHDPGSILTTKEQS